MCDSMAERLRWRGRKKNGVPAFSPQWGGVVQHRSWARAKRCVGLCRALLAILCLLLVGCREMVRPLDLRADDVEVASENPVLVRVAVCWSALPLAEDLTQLYGDAQSKVTAQRVSFDIIPGNSENTLERMVSGGADLAIVGGQPDAATLARSKDVRLETRVLALDAIAVVVPADAPLTNLSRDELAGLLTGRYGDWQELGVGSGAPEPVIREEGAATRVLVVTNLLGQESFASTALILPNDQAIVDYVAKHPLAVGYASVAWVDDRVRVLPIDGVQPTDAMMRRGRYPLSLPLVAVVPSPAPRPVADLLNLATTSRGRLAIDRHYTLPR